MEDEFKEPELEKFNERVYILINISI